MISLSIIIASKDRPDALTACLRALAVQSLPSTDFEVIVVDDGSTTPIATYIVQDMFPFDVTVLPQAPRGQAAALNRGAQAARSRFCLFLDDDIQADCQLVAEHLAVQLNTGGVIAVGHLAYEVSGNSDKLAHAVVHWARDHYARLGQGHTTVAFTDCYSGNLSVPRLKFLEVGGFRTVLRRGFDEELAYRLEQAGLEAHYLRLASGRHVLSKDAAAILRDSESAGAAYVRMCEWHPRMLEKVALAGYTKTRPMETCIRAILLRIVIPPQMLEVVARFFPNGRSNLRLYSLIHRYAFWTGVRKAMRPEQWTQLTRRAPREL